MFKPAKYRGRKIAVADAETDPFKRGRIPKPFIWGLFDGKNYQSFEKTEDFIDAVCMEEMIIYAHNGGKFDWHFITEYIDDFETLTIINGRLAKFQIGQCEFRDSFNLIPAPLSAYKKDEIDYSIFEADKRYKPRNWKKITEYLKSDCVYLYEMVLEFINTYGMSLTQASAAMKVWSKMSGIPKPKSTDAYYADLSPFYYGGRVECFRTGIIENDFKVIDINSAYPFAMIHKHPWGCSYSTYDFLPELNDNELSKTFITLKARSTGAFPYRFPDGLAFPHDNEIREFNITGWEYIAARDTETLFDIQIIEVRKYFQEMDFVEYVNFFFEEKKKAKQNDDQARYLFAKIFLNALYGKFASNPKNYEEFMTIPADMIDGAVSEGWNFCKLICEDTAVVNRPLQEEKHRYYDVAVSASITGFVRAYLWRNLCKTNGTMLYCDTDSIAASFIGDIPLSDKLGDWELEAHCDFAAIGGKKLYAFRKENGKWKTASKGVRLNPNDIISIAKGNAVTFEPEVPTFSIKGGIRFTPRTIQMTEDFY